MKIITKTTFVAGAGETVPPGTLIDIADDSEAKSYIDRGLAELPFEAVESEAEAAAKPAKK